MSSRSDEPQAETMGPSAAPPASIVAPKEIAVTPILSPNTPDRASPLTEQPERKPDPDTQRSARPSAQTARSRGKIGSRKTSTGKAVAAPPAKATTVRRRRPRRRSKAKSATPSPSANDRCRPALQVELQDAGPLQTLVDETRSVPAINATLFPSTDIRGYWTSSKAATDPNVYAGGWTSTTASPTAPRR